MRKNIWAYFGLVSGVIVLGFNGGCTKQSALSPLSNSNSTYTPLASNSTIYTPQEACNQFSSSLYNFYQGQNGNIFFSPFSIITAMAMAQEGAVGNTQVQMQNALDLNPNTTTRLQGFQQLISQINSPSKPYTLSTADNLWVQQSFPVLSSYENTLQTYYDSGVTNVDFVNNPSGAAQTIDGAVSQETYGHIPNLLSLANFTPYTRLVITNAIYFHADWLSKFVTTGTTPQTFTMGTGATESVSMMHQTLGANLGTYNGAASVIALPYTGNGASMYIFLPPVGGMSTLEGLMTGSNINAFLTANATTLNATSGTQVALALPRFTFSTNYDLTSNLTAMMPLAFTRPGPTTLIGANFWNMDGTNNLYITDVVHQAYVDVTETGTVAAAATGVVVGVTVMIVTYTPPPIPFVCDHPFIFMIVDNASNTVLFMGRMNDPLSTT